MPDKRRILIIDDNHDLADNLQELLTEDGLESTVCTDGKQAVQELGADGDYDLVITDYRMPGMDGIQLASWLREHRPQLPVLMFSGYVGELDVDTVRKNGVKEVFHKPHELERLLRLALELGTRSTSTDE